MDKDIRFDCMEMCILNLVVDSYSIEPSIFRQLRIYSVEIVQLPFIIRSWAIYNSLYDEFWYQLILMSVSSDTDSGIN